MPLDKELELYIEVNKKTIDIQQKAVDQNKEIISLLTESKNGQKEANEKLDRIVKQGEDTNRDIFQVKVLFATSLIALVAQIIQIFLHK